MVNSATLIGNLGKDPETKFTPAGKQVTNFSLATTEKYNGESKTTWHNIIAWGKLAEICAKYLAKGSKVYIRGKIQNRSYQDKDGSTKYISEIVAFDMTMLDSRGTGDSSPAQRQPQRQPQERKEETFAPDEEIPF